MTTRKTYILCAGESSRWNGSVCKQMVHVDDDEPLLCRTTRLFRSANPCVVCIHPFNFAVAATRLELFNSECACHTILQSSYFWPDNIIILLGDVFYTEDCANRILAEQESPAFYSDGFDIFAMVFSRPDFKMVTDTCHNAINDNRDRNTDGKCWDIYKAFAPVVKHWPIETTENAPFIRFVEDRTQDFDKEEEYEAFKRGITKNYIHAKRAK